LGRGGIAEDPYIYTGILQPAIYPAIPFASAVSTVIHELTATVIDTELRVFRFFCIDREKKVIQTVAIRGKGGWNGNQRVFGARVMLKVVDLFAGAGGFSLGLEQAGFEVVGAIEVDKFAVQTYKSNFPNTPVYMKPIEKLIDQWLRKSFQSVDLVCGGPPCQGFSVAGPSQYGIVDSRNGLMLEMARVVRAVLPTMVLLENVKGILHGKLGCGNKAIDRYFNTLSNLGYETRVYILQAADFGVPQTRQRVFLISVKNGCGINFPKIKILHF